MWLILETELDRVEAARVSFLANPPGAIIEASAPAPMAMSNGTANIHINGVLLPKRDAMLDMFGIEQTAYSDINAQISEAKSKGAKRARFHMNTPGGQIDGMYETMEAISGMGIPTEVIAGSVLASAGFMLASQADRITAQSEMSAIGSVGIVTGRSVNGYRKEITNTSSRNKRPDVSTPDGVAVVEAELEDFFQIIAEKIAEGRGVDVDTVKTKYGEGATMSARTALSLKMIDAIEKKPSAAKPAANNRGATMDLETMKREHPDTYQAIHDAGVKAERGRVSAHIRLAKASGDNETAFNAIASGVGVTDEVIAEHQAKKMEAQAVAARGLESVPNLSGAQSATPGIPGTAPVSSARETEAKFNELYKAKGFSLIIGGDK